MEEKAAEFLSDLSGKDLLAIADRCPTEKWPRIALFFEAQGALNYDQLKKRNLHASDADLCLKSFEDLAERGISLAQLTTAMDDHFVGLNSVAQWIRKSGFKKRADPSRSNDTKTPQQMPPINTHHNYPATLAANNQVAISTSKPIIGKYFDFPRRIPTLIDPTEQLASIHKLLDHNEIVVIHGISGFGKSTLAMEYGYHNNSYYDLVLWISCKDDASIVRGFMKLARQLNFAHARDSKDSLPTLKEYVESTELEQVKEYLKQLKFLMIFDNCNAWPETRFIYEHFYPTNMTGHAIFTTQLPEREWNTSEIPAASYIIQQYNKEATVEYMLKLAYPKSTPPYKESDYAAEIYSIYSGTPIFISLIARHVFDQKMTFNDFLKKYKKQIKNPAVDIHKIPLLMAFEKLDEQSIFVLRVLAINTTVGANDLYQLHYLTPHNSKTKEADFKQRFARLIDMALISIIDYSISIGHDIIQKYVTEAMMAHIDIIEGVIDQYFAQSTTISLHEKLFEFYSMHCSTANALNKLIEIAGIWKDTLTGRYNKAVDIKSTTNHNEQLWLLEGIHAFPNRVTDQNKKDLNEAFKTFKSEYGDQNIITMIAELYSTLCMDGDLSGLAARTQTLCAQSLKFQRLHFDVQSYYGGWLLRSNRVNEAIIQLTLCCKFAQDHLYYKEDILFKANLSLLEAEICANQNTRAKALQIFMDIMQSQTYGFFHPFLPLSAQMLSVSYCTGTDNSIPKLLYCPMNLEDRTGDAILCRMAEERLLSSRMLTVEFNKSLMDWRPQPIVFKLQQLNQMSSGQVAIVWWSPEPIPFFYNEDSNDTQCPYFIAIMKAIEFDFPLTAIHPLLLLFFSKAISEAMKWSAAKQQLELLGFKTPSDYASTPINQGLPPEIVGEDTYMFFTMILQLALADGKTIRQFIDILTALPLSIETIDKFSQLMMYAVEPKGATRFWNNLQAHYEKYQSSYSTS